MRMSALASRASVGGDARHVEAVFVFANNSQLSSYQLDYAFLPVDLSRMQCMFPDYENAEFIDVARADN